MNRTYKLLKLLFISVVCFFSITSNTVIRGEEVKDDIEIESIITEVDLLDDGSAIIEQTVDAVVESGTELSITYAENLVGVIYSDFSVEDADGNIFDFQDVLQGTMEEKKQKFTLSEIEATSYLTSQQIVFGAGSLGHNTYIIRYKILPVVVAFDECEGINYRFISKGGAVIPRYVKTVISSKNHTFTEQNTEAWVFGFRGKIEIINGKIIAESVYTGTYNYDYQEILVRFAENVFDPAILRSGYSTFESDRELAHLTNGKNFAGLKDRKITINLEKMENEKIIERNETLTFYFDEYNLEGDTLFSIPWSTANDFIDNIQFINTTDQVVLEYMPMEKWNKLKDKNKKNYFTVEYDDYYDAAIMKWNPSHIGEVSYSLNLTYKDSDILTMVEEDISIEKNENVNLMKLPLNLINIPNIFDKAEYNSVTIKGLQSDSKNKTPEIKAFGYKHEIIAQDDGTYKIYYAAEPYITEGFFHVYMIDRENYFTTQTKSEETLENIFVQEKEQEALFNAYLQREFVDDFDYERAYRNYLIYKYSMITLGSLVAIGSIFMVYTFVQKMKRKKAKITIDKTNNYQYFRNVDIPYYTGNPLESNLPLIYRVYSETKTQLSIKHLIEAYLFQWIFSEEIVMYTHDKGDKKITTLKLKNNLLTDDPIERELFIIFRKMANKRGVLKLNKAKHMAKRRGISLINWYNNFKNITTSALLKNGYAVLNENNECILTEEGVKVGFEVLGLNKYLKDCSTFAEENPIEESKWKEYLIISNIYGTMYKVCQHLKRIYPIVKKETANILDEQKHISYLAADLTSIIEHQEW